MKIYTMLFFGFWIASALFSACGYYAAGIWLGVPGVFCSALFWFFTRRRYPAVGLVSATVVNAIGIGTGVPVLFMLLSTCAALAAWDWLAFEQVQTADYSAGEKNWCRSSRLPGLALVLGTGFSLVFFGRLLRIRLSFYAVVIIVCLVFFCLGRILAILQKKK